MKRRITLQEAYHFIEESSAVIVDDTAVVYPSLWELTGEPDNEWLYLSWEDEGNCYYLKFIEEEQEILFDGTTIYMEDSKDYMYELKLLIPMNII